MARSIGRSRKITKPRKAKRQIYLLVDGECEKNYLNNLVKTHNLNQNLKIRPEITSQKKFSDQFDLICEQIKHYDRVFWVIDYDVIAKEKNQQKTPNSLYDNFIQKFQDEVERIDKENNTKSESAILIVNPCLEYWYLLHYKDTQKHYKSFQELEKDLKKVIKDYAKDADFQKKLFTILLDKMPTAIKHAQKIKRDNDPKNILARADIVDLFVDDFKLLK